VSYKSMTSEDLAAHFAEMDARYNSRCLLLRAICRSKAVYACNGFVVYGAGWIAVEFDEEGLPILSDKIVKKLKAAE
jgi:hypothetical protein